MPSRARSLAEDLRSRDDAQLARALLLRADTRRPIPRSFADLALRLNTGASVIEALDDLTAAQLATVEAACALAPGGRFGVTELAEGLDTETAVVAPLVDDLYDRVLLWGTPDDLRVPSAVREVMGPYPCGLDSVVRENLPGIRLALADPVAFEDRVSLAPDPARRLLLDHVWGPPTVPDLAGRDWLAAADFMASDEAGGVIVPREIALLLRRGVLVPDAALQPPLAPQPDPGIVPHAAHAADQFVRDTDRVMQWLARTGLLRQANGAFPARDFDRLATESGLPGSTVALILAVASAAGWTGSDADGRLRPTQDYDRGLTEERADRWACLVLAWLTMQRAVPRDPARLFAGRPDAEVPRHRRLVLRALAAGARDDPGRWLSWYRPRVSVPADQLTAAGVEAELLGLSFGGIPGEGGLAAVAGVTTPASMAAAIAPDLPQVTDRVILQADLTATSLGPLEPPVERRLAEVATWESGGGATVFRFTPESVRGALSRGIDGDAFLTWLRDHSATPVPQALEVLLADQRTALPSTSIHAVTCVVMCSPDESQRLTGDPHLAHLRLRELAPGVLACGADPTVVAAELLDRGILVTTHPTESGHVPPDGVVTPAAAIPDPDRVVRSLREVEAGDVVGAVEPPTPIPAAPSQVQAALAAAADAHGRLWLTFASDDGERITHLLEPLDLHDGDVCAFDHTAREIRTIPLERIVATAPFA